MQDDCLKGEFQDLVILAEFIVCSKRFLPPVMDLDYQMLYIVTF